MTKKQAIELARNLEIKINVLRQEGMLYTKLIDLHETNNTGKETKGLQSEINAIQQEILEADKEIKQLEKTIFNK